MEDADSLKFVVSWSVGGLVASGTVLSALLSVYESTPPMEVVTERAVESLDQQTCRRMMQTFVDQSRSGTQILWLWAEESTPRVFGAGVWTKHKVDPGKPLRPYAFHPES